MPKVSQNKFDPFYSLNLYCFDNLFKKFKILHENKSIPKVTLLSGDKGQGKFTFILHLIIFFFSNGKDNKYDVSNFVIDKENNFYNKILLDVNENFLYLGNNLNKIVSVEIIRDLKQRLTTNTLNNLPRFIILDDADLLNSNSANALLKLIEEPSSKNFFVLINNKRKKIIDTLRSRSIEFKIFLNKKQKENITNKLLNFYNLPSDKINNLYANKLSPGVLIQILNCLIDEKINLNNNLNSSIEILLQKYKKNKNYRYAETIKFLLYLLIYNTIDKDKLNSFNLFFLNIEINKLIYQYENFNLSNNIILDFVNKLPKNA